MRNRRISKRQQLLEQSENKDRQDVINELGEEVLDELEQYLGSDLKKVVIAKRHERILLRYKDKVRMYERKQLTVGYVVDGLSESINEDLKKNYQIWQERKTNAQKRVLQLSQTARLKYWTE